jgi:hypothetical protein
MRYALRPALAGIVALSAMIAPAAQAQTAVPPPTHYNYRDAQGPGVMTIQNLGFDRALGGNTIQVTLVQNRIRYSGSGLAFPLEGVQPPTTILAFTLLNPSGRAFFFNAREISGITVSADGTYHRVGHPERKFPWNIVIGGPVAKAGVKGVATAGPIRPVEVPGIPNTRPLQGAIMVIQPAGGGAEIARAKTDSKGRFEIVLAPGSYRLVPLPPNPQAVLPRAEPMEFKVAEGKFTELKVEFNTGIR